MLIRVCRQEMAELSMNLAPKLTQILRAHKEMNNDDHVPAPKKAKKTAMEVTLHI